MAFGGDNAEINDCLNDLVSDNKKNIQALNDMRQNLHNIQQEFFTEIKYIADQVNIKMPEPSEIELMEDKIIDPTVMVRNMLKRQNIEVNGDFLRQMQNDLKDINPEINKVPGGIAYKDELLNMMKESLN